MAIITLSQPLLVLLIIFALLLNFCSLPFFGVILDDKLESYKHYRLWRTVYAIFCGIIVLLTIFFPFAKWILKLSSPIISSLKYVIFSPLILSIAGILTYLTFQILALMLLIIFGYGPMGLMNVNNRINELKTRRREKRSNNLKSPSSWGGY